MNETKLSEKLAIETKEAETLVDLVVIQRRVRSGFLLCSDEMKKAIRDSIKELCMAILKTVEE